MSTTPAIQDTLFPDLTCFGCGPANPKGMQLKSHWEGDGPDGRAVATFTPWPEHDNGIGYLNGGIIATLLDCHSGATALQVASLHGWEPLGGALLAYVTAGIDVRYLRPAPLHEPVGLVGEVEHADEDEIRAVVRLEWDGKPRAEATAVWKRWRPRG